MLRENQQWNTDCPAIRSRLDALNQQYLSIKEQIESGDPGLAWQTMSKLQGDLVGLIRDNQESYQVRDLFAQLDALTAGVDPQLAQHASYQRIAANRRQAESEYYQRGLWREARVAILSEQSSLQAFLKQHETQAQQAARLAANLQQMNAHLTRINALQSELASLQKELDGIKATNTNLSIDAAAARKERDVVEDKNKAGSKELARVREENSGLTKERDQLKADRDSLKSQIASLQAQVAALESLAKSGAEPANPSTELVDLAKQIGGLDTKNWDAANQALGAALASYEEKAAEKNRLLLQYRENSPTMQRFNGTLKQHHQLLAQALSKRDQVDSDLFQQLQARIDGLGAERRRLIDVERMLSTSQRVTQLDQQMAGAAAQQVPYAAGHQRATGVTQTFDAVQIARQALPTDWFYRFDGRTAGEQRVVTYQGIEIAVRWCPPGTFLMGSPASESGREADENQVSVTLSRGFWMFETEVTQQLWQTVMGSAPAADYGRGPTHPVYNVSYDDARAFARKLTDELRAAKVLPPDAVLQLPTEARWEYAARAGTKTAYHFGNDASQLDEYAWFDDNSHGATHPVATRKPNAWGLHDMAGNVWEWCADGYADKLPGGTDPLVSPDGASSRVDRGSGWLHGAAYCRSAIRSGHYPSARDRNLGFRLALSSDGAE